ncbi:S9 family peptidase [Maribellus maritimus]|uniref:S9 family peptidase n=1 Tax=Maribellus maritimus TaxID=2870838 RepID=UPI001EEA5970|nr:S9 family peptidase [Maribellus maritimus]MCG6186226.1 S9 family peptidase [Maribellus maritimus]
MKKIALPLLVIFTLVSSSVFSQSESPLSSNLKITDVFDMEFISDPQISPDGNKIIYVRNFMDIMTDQYHSNLWIINRDGSNNRPLTQGNQSDYAPKWSHDGSKIAFLSNQQDKKVKLYVMYLDTREIVALTNTKYAPGEINWSPDDWQLAFTKFVPAKKDNLLNIPSKPEGAKWNEPPVYIDDINYRADGRGYLKSGKKQIFTITMDGGTARQWTFSAHNHSSPVWSADSKQIYFSANLHKNHELEPLNTEIYQLHLETGEIVALTSRFGPDDAPSVSPDGKQIAYLGFDDSFQGYQVTNLYVMKADGSGSKLLAPKLDRDISNIHWKNDGKGIYFQYADKGDDKIGFVDLTNSKTETLVNGMGGLSLGRPYNAGSYSVSKNNSFAFTIGSTEHPADLGMWKDGKKSRLTKLNDDLFSFRKVGNVEEIWWNSSFDNKKIQGWIVTPPDFDPSKKYPLILEIHGGPFAMYGTSFAAEIQLFAAAGYVVLYSNPRGSTGYGQEFGNAIHHDYPNHDYDDLMSGVDAVIEKGFIDKNNLFVTGGSGGGILTAWIVGKTDRFKAAVSAKPVINWVSEALYSDIPIWATDYMFGGKPWDVPDEYFRRSPLSLVPNVKTPTMLLTGENDLRTPIGEAEQFYTALKLEEVETALVRIPGAYHGITSKPSGLVYKVASILSWFDHYKNKK